MAIKVQRAEPKPVRTWPADVVTYPFRGPGKYVLASGPAILLLLRLLRAVGGDMGGIIVIAGQIIIQAVLLGYFMLYCVSVIAESAGGEDEAPDWPELSDFTDIVLPAVRFAGAVAVSFLPLIALGLLDMRYSENYPTPSLAWLYITLLCLGFLYFPMAVTGVAMFQSLDGLAPVLVVRSIIRTAPAYLATCAIFFAAYICDGLITAFVATKVPFLGRVLSVAISFYIFMVQARVLGLFYRLKRKRLGWFDMGQRDEDFD